MRNEGDIELIGTNRQSQRFLARCIALTVLASSIRSGLFPGRRRWESSLLRLGFMVAVTVWPLEQSEPPKNKKYKNKKELKKKLFWCRLPFQTVQSAMDKAWIKRDSERELFETQCLDSVSLSTFSRCTERKSVTVCSAWTPMFLWSTQTVSTSHCMHVVQA